MKVRRDFAGTVGYVYSRGQWVGVDHTAVAIKHKTLPELTDKLLMGTANTPS